MGRAADVTGLAPGVGLAAVTAGAVRTRVLSVLAARREWASRVALEAQLARRGPWLWLGRRFGCLRETLVAWLAAEVDERRHLLWTPVCLGVGVLWYFLGQAPGHPWPALIAALSLLLAAVTRRGAPVRMTLLGATLIIVGFALAAWRVALMETVTLKGVAQGSVTGLVVQADERPTGQRIVLAPISLPDSHRTQGIAYITLTLQPPDLTRPGMVIEARARLSAPSGPVLAGGYDFARDAWFRQVGATGAAWGVTEMGDPSAAERASATARLAAWIETGRNALTERIASAWGGEAGAVAAALVTGKRGQISEATNAELRAAGIYHILSISGLHMALAATMFFWSARALMALSPWCALRLPLRKIAAAVAIAGSAAYCVFSGADVATVRALIMITTMLGAVLVDRPALSMHNLALAAIIVLAWRPESLLAPGFQMSYAAVAALIATFGDGRTQQDKPRAMGRADRWLWAPLRTCVLATIVCELATAPFSIWHFQAVYPLGLIGNAMTLPFLSLAVMPAAVLGVLMWPFGIDWPVWLAMGAATEPVLYVSRRIAETPWSVAAVPAMPGDVVLILTAGLLWLVIWRGPLRWFAIAPLAIGLLMGEGGGPFSRSPDIMIDRSGRGALVRLDDGGPGAPRLALLGEPHAFTAAQWLRAHGDLRTPSDPTLRNHVSCVPAGCYVARADGGQVWWTRRPEALTARCTGIDVLITTRVAPSDCRPALLLDALWLNKHGATSVWLRDGQAKVETARTPNESWPWRRSLPVLWPESKATAASSSEPQASGEAAISSDGRD